MRPMIKIKFNPHRMGVWFRAHPTIVFAALVLGLLSTLLLLQIMLPPPPQLNLPKLPVPVSSP
jgi:hypothetical protein